MRPQRIGRFLGIGLRVAGHIAGQRMGASAQNRVGGQSSGQVFGRTAGKTTKGIVRGLGGFLRPFWRVGGILWLEVMGVFFFLPVLYYAPALWRTRASFAHSQDASGQDHGTFLLSAIVMAIFFYLSVSSFWRARKK